MIITVAKNAGFCPGVKRADRSVFRLLAERREGERIFTLGKLIHNRTYNEALASLGAEAIEFSALVELLKNDPSALITLVVRTHGITKEQSLELDALKAAYSGFDYIDMTCPSVKKIHKIAEENTGDNTVFLLFCNENHPEAKGIMSYAKGEKHAISSPFDLDKIDFSGKTPILCSQTTENLEIFKKIKKNLLKLCTNAIFFDTICSVTEIRQNETLSLAEKSDLMIVIGGRDSSNTHKLYELCKKACPRVLWIEEAKELDGCIPADAKCVGITAGASTPDGIITEVLKTMENKEMGFQQLLDDTFKTLHTGDTVNGIVCTIGQNEIKLDLGVKVTGVLTKEQITDDASADLRSMFKIGDEVSVFVIRVDDKTGLATVSKKRVDADNSWVALKDAYDNKVDLAGKVVSANKGGVLVACEGNTVFVPASQTGVARGGDLSALVGTETKIRLIEFDTVKKKALGSIKAILVEEARAKEAAIFANLEVGQKIKGTVKNLAAYGAFVDIGGVDGMVHNSELSWKRIKHPSQVVSVGQEIDVYIKEIDVEKKRISLGYKTDDMDTWLIYVKNHSVGEIVSGKIVSLTPFGAFCEVAEGVDGLIHISAISTEKIANAADALKIGEEVNVKIVAIDEEKRTISLSIRAIIEAEQRAAAEEARKAELAEKRAEAEAEAKRIAEERADMAPYIVGSID